MPGRRIVICRIAVASIALVATTTCAEALESPDDLISAVRRLGADDFEDRREAGNLLLRAGESALPMLREAALSESPEIRYRALDLLLRIERQMLEMQISEIEAGGPLEGDLPVWSRYAQTVGSDPLARKLLVQMLDRAPDIMLTIGTDNTQDQFDLAVNEWLTPVVRRRPHLDISQAAVLLFAMLQPECEPTAATANLIVQHLNSASIRSALNDQDVGPTIKGLIADWIALPEGPPQMRLNLAQSHQLAVGRAPAVEILRSAAPGPELQAALLFLASHGQPEDVPDVERMLDNTQELTSARGAVNAVTSEVRDVALVTLWKLQGENPAQHGMGSYVEHAGHPKPGSIGFPSDEARMRAISDWRSWRKSHVKAHLPPDGRAIEGGAA